jgi:hypothetical protein
MNSQADDIALAKKHFNRQRKYERYVAHFDELLDESGKLGTREGNELILGFINEATPLDWRKTADSIAAKLSARFNTTIKVNPPKTTIALLRAEFERRLRASVDGVPANDWGFG